jgi:long-chain acyl-CoA synthetase
MGKRVTDADRSGSMTLFKRWSYLGKFTDAPRDERSVEEIYRHRPQNVYELLCRSVERYPNKEAFVCDDDRLTYREFQERVVQISQGLSELCGVSSGDRVGLLLGNSMELALCFFATARIGGIGVILNTRLPSEALEQIIDDSSPRVLIVHEACWETLAPIKARLGTVQHVVVAPQSSLPGIPGLDELNGCAKEAEVVSEGQICCLMYTSGTTGLPKGVMITHRNIVINSINCHIVEDFQAEDVNLIMVPLFHVTGLFGQLLLATYVGGKNVILTNYKTEKVLSLIEREQVSFIATVPTILRMMMRHPDHAKYDVRSLKKIMFGGAPSDLPLIRELVQSYPGAKICEGFGMTEATVVVTLLPPEDCTRKLNSVGLPLPFVDIKIVDDHDQEVKVGEVGELCVRGPTVAKGYWNNPKGTQETFRDGWLHTGDLARFDEEGYIFVMGRKKEMIIRGGENVYCVEVENVLCSHPDVVEAVLVGVPDEVFGEEGKAVIVYKPGREARVNEILEYCRRRLAPYQVPKYITATESLPRNSSGKVLKGLLR